MEEGYIKDASLLPLSWRECIVVESESKDRGNSTEELFSGGGEVEDRTVATVRKQNA
jgi:hypothetical protein